jgi:hypothetical protein
MDEKIVLILAESRVPDLFSASHTVEIIYFAGWQLFKTNPMKRLKNQLIVQKNHRD